MKKNSCKSIRKQINLVNFILIFVISFEFALKFLLIFKHKIAWDEFYFLSKVHSFQKGELTQPFQNFHIHLLGWLPWVSDNEITQVVAARFVLFFLFIACGVLLYLIARYFISRSGALFAVFCWVSLSNVIQHGSSLRYDSFCSFLFLLACFALMKENRKLLYPAIAGIAMGVSLLISLKAAIHVVSLFALLGAIGLTSPDKVRVFKKGALFITLLTLTFCLGLLIHQSSLSAAALPNEENFLHHASSKAIVFKEFFPQRGYFSQTLVRNLFIWMLLGAGVSHTTLKLMREKEKKGLIALAFLVPLFSIPFYRNAFPYYYVFAIAPAVMFCGTLPQNILQDFRKSGSKALLLIFAFISLQIAVGAAIHFFNAFCQNNRFQKELISTVHKMFPEPVPYIDGCSAVASYPQVAFFMSTWGFENYLADGQPVFRRILQEEHPQFLLADTPHLDVSMPREDPFFKNNGDFLEEDRKTLEENFVRYWGMIFVPGKTLKFNRSGEQQNFEILIPGPYVIEGNKQVFLDEKLRSPGEKIMLTNGRHTARSTRHDHEIILRWGKVNHVPLNSPPAILTFYGF